MLLMVLWLQRLQALLTELQLQARSKRPIIQRLSIFQFSAILMMVHAFVEELGAIRIGVHRYHAFGGCVEIVLAWQCARSSRMSAS